MNVLVYEDRPGMGGQMVWGAGHKISDLIDIIEARSERFSTFLQKHPGAKSIDVGKQLFLLGGRKSLTAALAQLSGNLEFTSKEGSVKIIMTKYNSIIKKNKVIIGLVSSPYLNNVPGAQHAWKRFLSGGGSADPKVTDLLKGIATFDEVMLVKNLMETGVY